jgi:hypothetical protein
VVVEDDLGKASAWHPFTGELLADVPLETHRAVTWRSADAVLVHDRLVRIEGTADGEVRVTPPLGDVGRLAAHGAPVTGVSAWRHGDSARVATCGGDGVLRVSDLVRQEVLDEVALPAPAGGVVALPGGHVVVRTDDEVLVFRMSEAEEDV